jgi:nitroreductase
VNNTVLKSIKERRTIFRFKSTPISNEQLNLVLEDGRWAPSWANTQPWRSIVINDKETKEKICSKVTTIFSLGIKDPRNSLCDGKLAKVPVMDLVSLFAFTRGNKNYNLVEGPFVKTQTQRKWAVQRLDANSEARLPCH